ncbi:hypothetical protein M2323_003974 [Rhodoblastus acidophilus]|uniref:hypothetical protein n=1 Tax=Rhodoblastus acidophilus TaxID=1074 RepID=UPI0022245171|nr:hypothetical protein [Rhodoblastus acidophilus]MCW2286137.1 hypothetical protein [Rhodoblastus acidophilus]MCW2335031.1 hypothetical protein [Rhodoblastus acidophilus]
MGKAELFTEITNRNALRREAGLPLLNIRDEIESQQNAFDWKTFIEIRDQHRAVRDEITARVRLALAAEKGFDCLSHGGRLLLGAKVEAEFLGYLRGLGVKIPKSSGTRYGSRS